MCVSTSFKLWQIENQFATTFCKRQPQSTRRTPCTSKKKMEIEIDGMEYYKINNRTFKRKTVNKCQCSKSLDICIWCIQKYSKFSSFVHLISIVRSKDSLLVILFAVVVPSSSFFLQSVFVKDSFCLLNVTGLFGIVHCAVAINLFFSVLSSFMTGPT